MTIEKLQPGGVRGKGSARNPTRRKTLSRAALALRQRELDALNFRSSGEAYTVNNPLYRCFSVEFDAPSLRLHRRDILITREVVSAKRNALVVIQWEPKGRMPKVTVGLWVKGGERVITLRSPVEGKEDLERVFLREEVTFVGVAIGYARREWRRTYAPPVHVYKGGA